MVSNEAAHHAVEHAEHASPHIVNWVTLLAKATEPSLFSDFLLRFEKVIFAGIVIALLTYVSVRFSKNMKLIPTKGQLFMEEIIQALDNLVVGVLGKDGRRYSPFIGSLFIYILANNLFGLLPLQNSATAYITTTAPLALCVFFYVQWTGITKNGIPGYIYHLAGSPKDLFGYLFIPLIFPLHIMSEFVKPISLMFRLYGNIMAGHILVAVFLGMGIQILAPLKVPFGLPLHFPFLFLELLLGTIQAFVFALLSTVYISMMLPHEHEEHAAVAS